MSAIFNFFYIYDPWLFHFFRMAFFSGFVALFFLIIKLYRNKQIQGIFIPLDNLVVIIILIMFSFIPLLLNRSKDLSVVIQYTKFLIFFICAVGIYNLFYYFPNGKFTLIRDLKIGVIVQFCVGILSLIGISFITEFALSTNALLVRFYGSEQEYRLYNITSSAFFQLSVFYLFLLNFLLAYNKKYNNINPIFLFLILFIGLISGRTFIMLSIVSISFYFKKEYILPLLAFFMTCLFLAINFSQHKYVAHALEPLINLINDHSLHSSSTDTLIRKHLFLPEIKQILIGDGYYFTEQGKYYGHTDSGFLRQILYGGFSYLIICFLFTAYFVYKVATNWFDGSKVFILSTLLILSILNVKADTYAFPNLIMMFLIFLSFFGHNSKFSIVLAGRK